MGLPLLGTGWPAWGILGLIGLCVGSFLNVLIHRLPIMLFGTPTEGRPEPLALHLPPSHCPACRRPLLWHENVPVLSWLALRGRCAGCGTGISVRYPMVELAGALLPLGLAAAAGPAIGADSWAAALFVWVLIAIAVIDFDHQLIPDVLSLPLLAAGLLLHPVTPAGTLWAALLGAGIGYAAPALMDGLGRLALGQPAVGMGDWKLMAAIGAWLGGYQPLLVLFLGCLIGGVLGSALLAARRVGRGQPIPFGPFLCLGALAAYAAGDALVAWYLHLAIG